MEQKQKAPVCGVRRSLLNVSYWQDQITVLWSQEQDEQEQDEHCTTEPRFLQSPSFNVVDVTEPISSATLIDLVHKKYDKLQPDLDNGQEAIQIQLSAAL